MNRILITARKSRALTEKQVAKQLKIDETLYKEIEYGISPISQELGQTLEQLYNVPDYFFITPCFDNIQTSIDASEKLKEILDTTPDIQNISVPAHSHLSIAKMGLDALIAKQQQILLMIQVKELVAENDALKALYDASKKES
jgi:transcriptional regulator with XRE-family HTH domain